MRGAGPSLETVSAGPQFAREDFRRRCRPTRSGSEGRRECIGSGLCPRRVDSAGREGHHGMVETKECGDQMKTQRQRTLLGRTVALAAWAQGSQ